MTVRTLFKHFGLYIGWMIALVAMGGSLYFSEVRNFVPCILCWYQRILMYPLVILLGIASYRQDRAIGIYVLPFTVTGAGVALYHYLDQQIPGFGAPALCQVGVPCSVEYINWFGFVTIPFLALTAFVLITVFVLGAMLSVAASRSPSAPAESARSDSAPQT